MSAGVYGNNSVILLDNNQLKRFEMDVFKSVLQQMEPYYTVSYVSLYSSMIHITRRWFSFRFVIFNEMWKIKISSIATLTRVSPCVAHPGQSTSDQSSSGWNLRFQLDAIRISRSRKLRRLPSTFMFCFSLYLKWSTNRFYYALIKVWNYNMDDDDEFKWCWCCLQINKLFMACDVANVTVLSCCYGYFFLLSCIIISYSEWISDGGWTLYRLSELRQLYNIYFKSLIITNAIER